MYYALIFMAWFIQQLYIFMYNLWFVIGGVCFVWEMSKFLDRVHAAKDGYFIYQHVVRKGN